MSPDKMVTMANQIAGFFGPYSEDEAIEAFVDYMLSDDGLAAVSEVGYVDLNGGDSARAKTIWAARLTGQGQWSED